MTLNTGKAPLFPKAVPPPALSPWVLWLGPVRIAAKTGEILRVMWVVSKLLRNIPEPESPWRAARWALWVWTPEHLEWRLEKPCGEPSAAPSLAEWALRRPRPHVPALASAPPAPSVALRSSFLAALSFYCPFLTVSLFLITKKSKDEAGYPWLHMCFKKKIRQDRNVWSESPACTSLLAVPSQGVCPSASTRFVGSRSLSQLHLPMSTCSALPT